MKKIVLLAAMMLGLTGVVSADNLLYNGEFKRLDAKGWAPGWALTNTKNAEVKFFASGAPDGGFVRISFPTEGQFELRQHLSKKFAPNTKYKVSFKMRGTVFTSADLGVIFINDGWSKSSGARKLVPTAQWKEYEYVFATPEYKKYLGFVILARKAKGTVEFADVEIEALDND